MPKNDKKSKEYNQIYDLVYTLHDKADTLARALKNGKEDTTQKANDLTLRIQNVKQTYNKATQETKDGIFDFYAQTIERAEMLADSKQIAHRLVR